MLYQFEQSAEVSFAELWQILIRGAWMDLAMTGYILLLTSIAIAALGLCSSKCHIKFFKYSTLVLLSVFSIIIVADFELYRNWLFRIDATPLLYLKTPKEAMASTPIWSTILLLLLIVVYVWAFYLLYRKLVLPVMHKIERCKWWTIPSFVLIAGFMILPIRGGVGIAPMNPSKVYFSKNVYCNHAALNAPWNMFYACSESSDMNHRYPDVVSAEVASEQFAAMMCSNPDSSTCLLNNRRPNVVLILLESFTAKAIEAQGGKSGVTPCLNRLSAEGINFTNVYSAAYRSDKGIVAVVSGFPAQAQKSVIKYPSKSAKLPSISKTLADEGYSTTFYYGGDPTFACISSFLYAQQFGSIVSQDEFPVEYRNSKWGVHDEYVFSRLLHDIDTARAPFFKMLFTLTSHEPYETPAPRKIIGDTEEDKFLNSMCYTDSCLGSFFDEAKTRDWYKNTLFVLIADHGHRLPNNDISCVPQRFRIPMVWLGGALKCQPFVEQKVCAQFDLAATLLSQLGLDISPFTFSKDVLNPTSQEFAYYVFNNGYGFVTPMDTLVVDKTSGNCILNTSDALVDQAGSFYRIYQDHFLGL